jgi:hypothetical protein
MVMVFRANGLRDAFEGQGEAGFTDWSYASYDPLETILAPGYFASVDRLAPGHLIHVGTRPRPANSPWATQQQGTETRRALLMVRGRDDKGVIQVRLVQDYGRPEDADAVLAAEKKPRGRPPKKVEAG